MPNLKIFGWSSSRSEAAALIPEGQSFNLQTREIMAAKSGAEVMRAAGLTRTAWKHSGCETWNEAERALAMSDPGVIFWCLLSSKYQHDGPRWFRDGETPRPNVVDL